MLSDHYFLRESVIDVDAAVVGISKSSWISSTTPNESEAAKEMMQEHRFDVLPIEPEAGEINSYYITQEWNDFSEILQREITFRDVLPFQTSIRDVIKGFAYDDRQFYFLTNESRIVGLITISNLNARQVVLYLFSLISELEILFSRFIGRNVSEGDLFLLKLKDKVANHQLTKAKNRYMLDCKKGVDSNFLTYLYFSDLLQVLEQTGLCKITGYEGDDFLKHFRAIKKLRNQIAHPTNSIIRDKNGAKALWERIDLIEETLFKLRRLP